MAPPQDSGSLIARITRVLDELSPSERRLAEFMLDFPGNLPAYTASELAKTARVSNATVTRFIQRLGYTSFGEARRHVRLEQKAGSPLLRSESNRKTDGSLFAHIELGIQNLTETYSSLSEDTLNRIAKAIIDANRVWFLGLRNNHSFAAYMRWQIFRTLENCILLPVSGETIGEYAATIRKGDVLVVFALRRTMTVSSKLIAHAARSGAEILCITDDITDDPGPATWVLRCHTKAAGALDSHVAVISLAHFIATRVLELSGREGRRRMSSIEAAHELFQEMS